MRKPISEVFNIDCMEYMRSLPDKFFELAVVDPPYGINVAKMAYTQEEDRPCKQKNGKTLTVKKLAYRHGDWDSNSPSTEYIEELKRVSKNQIIWGINYMNFHCVGGRIVWNKHTPDGTSFSDAEIAYCSLHERVRIFDYLWAGMMQAESLLNPIKQQGNKSLNEKRIHPTQKPVALYKWILENYAKAGDKILDTHLGSQSSRIAAYDLGFDFYGCELDSQYFNEGCARFEAHRTKVTEIRELGFAKTALGEKNPTLF